MNRWKFRDVLECGDGVCAVAALDSAANCAARRQVHSPPQPKRGIGPIFPALQEAATKVAYHDTFGGEPLAG